MIAGYLGRHRERKEDDEEVGEEFGTNQFPESKENVTIATTTCKWMKNLKSAQWS